MQPPDGTNTGSREGLIASPGTSDNALLAWPSREKHDMTAALQRRVGQSDARVAFRTPYVQDPLRALVQGLLFRKKGGGVAVFANPQQRHIEEWAPPSEGAAAVELLQSG